RVQELTIEAWVNLDTLPGRQIIIRKSIDSVWGSFSLQVEKDGHLRLTVQDETNAKWPVWRTTSPLAAGGWYHIAGTFKKQKYDASDGKIYINGLAQTTTFTANGYAIGFMIEYTAGGFFIGMQHGQNYPLDGTIDEVRIWNTALTEFRLDQVAVAMDIKPGSCPNPLNVKSQGVLPVAILGTEGFDVTQVDPAIVKLEGVAPLRWAIEDVATPSEKCNTFGPDGYLDLTLKFDTQEILIKLKLSTSDLVDESEIVLSDLEDGESLMLTLTGYLYDGTPILGEDTVLIIKKGKF
ncbi:unnamed protein product, partial [marine sediment metagenome]